MKPENIFLRGVPYNGGPFPVLVLADFENATTRAVTDTGGSGTPAYCGPEYPEFSTASDIWGLGSIIHFLCHRRPAMIPLKEAPYEYQQRRNVDVLRWERSSRSKYATPLPHSYSSKLNSLMMKCLERDPKNRITAKTLVDRIADHIQIQRYQLVSGERPRRR